MVIYTMFLLPVLSSGNTDLGYALQELEIDPHSVVTRRLDHIEICQKQATKSTKWVTSCLGINFTFPSVFLVV